MQPGVRTGTNTILGTARRVSSPGGVGADGENVVCGQGSDPRFGQGHRHDGVGQGSEVG